MIFWTVVLDLGNLDVLYKDLVMLHLVHLVHLVECLDGAIPFAVGLVSLGVKHAS